MPSKKTNTKRFLAVWDMLGLESIFDVDLALEQVDAYEKEKMVAILKEEQLPVWPNPIPLQTLILRARVNQQRKYEIYEFSSELDMDEVKNLFKDNPQFIVDWIRKNGNKIYSDYNENQKNQVIF